MKRKKQKTAGETYDQCMVDGYITNIDFVDSEKAKALLESANKDSKYVEKINKIETDTYSINYKLYYDIFHQLVEGLVLFDKLNISNHVCLFSYLIVKHAGLELDWETLESMRIIRNRICYDGKIVTKEIWDRDKLKFKLYTNAVKEQLEKRLKK